MTLAYCKTHLYGIVNRDLVTGNVEAVVDILFTMWNIVACYLCADFTNADICSRVSLIFLL